MNPITRTLNVDNLLLLALQEDISSEDVSTNAVMPEAKPGEVQLICKEDGITARERYSFSANRTASLPVWKYLQEYLPCSMSKPR